jgi:putative phosphoesterase
MKIAVLADIHANFIALQSVVEHLESWKPDEVIVAGDIVNRGPRPLQCLDFVRERANTQGWLTVRGNHEDYVISRAQPDQPQAGPFFDVHQGSYWTYRQLNSDVSPLEAMPFQQTLLVQDGGEVRITHASMRGNRDGVYPETSDETLKKQMGPPPAIFCVGHTHRPLIRRLCGALVVNVGSAGLPFDGDAATPA